MYTINHVCVSRAIDGIVCTKQGNVLIELMECYPGGFLQKRFSCVAEYIYCAESMNDLMNKSLYVAKYISDGVFKYPFSSCTLKDIDEEELVC